jgi:pyruvate dehydrogenase E2 component (dihydrolipoamide acetyltransferase)
MAVAVIMPELGESIVEGTIVRWLKHEGESVQEDEPIVEIMTDKVNTELPAPASGILQQILAAEGATVTVGQELALIASASEAATPAEPAAPTPTTAPPPVEAVGFYGGEEPAPVAAPAPATPPRADGQSRSASGQPFISPVVSKIAREHGISHEELLTIPGTGTGGRVTRKDIEAYIAQRKATPAPKPAPAPQPVAAPAPPPVAPREGEEVIPLVGMRKVIAEHLTKSYQTAVHVTTVIQVDVSKLVESASATRSRSSSSMACA